MILSFTFYVFAENNSTTSNNIFADSDQDGLSDQEEKIYGTDPHNKDTDNDGYTDGVEVASGYDPLKPAPGDKIIQETVSNTQTSQENQENLTKKLAYQITQIANGKSDSTEITTDDIQMLVDSAIPEEGVGGDTETATQEPLFTAADFKIKEQNYGNLSEEKAKEKKKEDFVKYIAAIFYVFSSNSPQAITSDSSLESFFGYFIEKITSAVYVRNASLLDELSQSGERIIEQLKDVEVPEEMADFHIQALTFAKYAQDMKGFINANSTDPVADIQNLSQVSGLMTNVSELFDQLDSKFTEYELSDDTTALNEALSNYEENKVGE